MNNPPKVEVQFSARFLKDIRKLQKRFPSLQADLQPFITRLQQGEFPGDQNRGTSHTVYKARLPNRDSKRGQSGGYRVIYFLRTQTHTVLLTIYSKSDIEDVSPEKSLISSEMFLAEQSQSNSTVPRISIGRLNNHIPTSISRTNSSAHGRSPAVA